MSLSPLLRLPRRPAPNEKNTTGQSRQILEGATLSYAKQTYSFFKINQNIKRPPHCSVPWKNGVIFSLVATDCDAVGQTKKV